MHRKCSWCILHYCPSLCKYTSYTSAFFVPDSFPFSQGKGNATGCETIFLVLPSLCYPLCASMVRAREEGWLREREKAIPFLQLPLYQRGDFPLHQRAPQVSPRWPSASGECCKQREQTQDFSQLDSWHSWHAGLLDVV